MNLRSFLTNASIGLAAMLITAVILVPSVATATPTEVSARPLDGAFSSPVLFGLALCLLVFGAVMFGVRRR